MPCPALPCPAATAITIATNAVNRPSVALTAATQPCRSPLRRLTSGFTPGVAATNIAAGKNAAHCTSENIFVPLGSGDSAEGDDLPSPGQEPRASCAPRPG